MKELIIGEEYVFEPVDADEDDKEWFVKDDLVIGNTYTVSQKLYLMDDMYRFFNHNYYHDMKHFKPTKK